MLQRIVVIFTRQTGWKSGRRQKKSNDAEVIFTLIKKLEEFLHW